VTPIHSIEHEAHHLYEVERAGESAETPLIAIVGAWRLPTRYRIVKPFFRHTSEMT
jgi:hypothetical protein